MLVKYSANDFKQTTFSDVFFFAGALRVNFCEQEVDEIITFAVNLLKDVAAFPSPGRRQHRTLNTIEELRSIYTAAVLGKCIFFFHWNA